ncbi:MAG: queuosine precursor transporter [Anaerolineae bacterium]|nr:queuosine precursor transporter [Anaerolineae bacterium]
MLVVAAYIAAQMLSDLMSLKIAYVASFSVDAGTFIYPFTFTLRDLVHKLLGKRCARIIIITAGVINLVMAGCLAFAVWLPADPAWPLQSAFASVLAPTWRIVIASIIAEVIAELLDTELYSLWMRYVTQRVQWSRVLISNAISIPVDSLVFVWCAFGQWGELLPGGLSDATVWAIFWSNVLLKGAVTIVSLPGIYIVPGQSSAGDASIAWQKRN